MSALAITGIGAVTPVGLCAPASCAALRAAVSGVSALELSEADGPAGPAGPPLGGRVPIEWFGGGPADEEWPGHERFEQPPPKPEHLIIRDGAARLIELAVPAGMECWNRANLVAPPQPWGLFLGTAEDEEPNVAAHVAAALARAWGHMPNYLDVLPNGRAAGLFALHHAAASMAAGQIALAVVGAVDSLLRPSVLSKLGKAGVLKPENPHGILPGEAAAFMILEARPRGAALGFLTGSAVAEEPTAGTDEPNKGVGLSEVLRSVRKQSPLEYAPLVICDLNGERYRALEWGLALTRALGDLAEQPGSPTSGDFWHPADCTGDTGAASGILDCIWAIESFARGYAGGDRVLVWGASDTRPRAAAMIHQGG